MRINTLTWDILRCQQDDILDHLDRTWQTTQELMNRYHELVQQHRDALHKRQALLDQQASFLQQVSAIPQAHTQKKNSLE